MSAESHVAKAVTIDRKPLPDDDHVMLVAQSGAEPVGNIQAHKKDPVTMWLASIRVSGEARQGVGSRLLGELDTVAQQTGCVVIEGELTQADVATQPWLPTFYTKNGYEVTPNNSRPGDFRIAKSVTKKE